MLADLDVAIDSLEGLIKVVSDLNFLTMLISIPLVEQVHLIH